LAQTRIFNLLAIRSPIIQAPMNWVGGAAFTASVSVPKRFMPGRDLQNTFTETFKMIDGRIVLMKFCDRH
jgi:hypothetical protein